MQQGIGGTISIAGLTTILQHRTAYHATMLDQQQALSLLGMGELLAPVRDIVSRAGAIGAAVDAQALDALRQFLEQQATVAAYQDCFFLLAALGVIMVPLVCFLRGSGVRCLEKELCMPTIKFVAERTATGRVREIYDEIKAVLGTAFVPVNFSRCGPQSRPPGSLLAAV